MNITSPEVYHEYENYVDLDAFIDMPDGGSWRGHWTYHRDTGLLNRLDEVFYSESIGAPSEVAAYVPQEIHAAFAALTPLAQVAVDEFLAKEKA